MRQIDEQLLTDVMDKHDILNQSRLRQHVWKRSAFAYFLRKHGYTFARIGQMLEKDHATIIHALKIYDNNKRYADFKACVMPIESDLQDCAFESMPIIKDVNTKYIMSQVRLENLIGDKLK